jgi:hypothetical protein
MYGKFRLVILDYPKTTIRNSDTKQALSDMLCAKQANFERSSLRYVPMSGLDMVSTHFLIYDVTNLFSSKPILAIRTCFEQRVKSHDLTLPIDEYISIAPESYQQKFERFRRNNFPLVDCNAWFVDPDYGFSKTSTSLSEIAYFMVITFILRKNYSNWVGATNERFKASRWASKTGYFEDGLIFTHHKVKDPHKLLLIDSFDYQWLHSCVQKYGHLLEQAYEIFPETMPDGETLLPLKQIFEKISNKQFEGISQYTESQKLAL